MNNMFRWITLCLLLLFVSVQFGLAQDDNGEAGTRYILRVTVPSNSSVEEILGIIGRSELEFVTDINSDDSFLTAIYNYSVQTEEESIDLTDIYRFYPVNNLDTSSFENHIMEVLPQNSRFITRSLLGIPQVNSFKDDIELISPAGQDATAGGPNGIPANLDHDELNQNYSFDFPTISFESVNSNKMVTVVILDAAPNMAQLSDSNASSTSGDTEYSIDDTLLENADNDFLTELKYVNRLTVHRPLTDQVQGAPQQQDNPCAYLSTNSTPNSIFTSHGVFSASIILSVVGLENADRVKFELVPVLNSEGKGNLTCLIHNLEAVHNDIDDPESVIYNMSLHTIEPGFCDPSNSPRSDSCSEFDHFLNNILAGVIPEPVALVAAAGNYNANGGTPTRPGEAYPAAFENVIGVGSVDRYATISDFSHTAEYNANGEGFYVLGEDIVGVYLDAFPTKDVNGNTVYLPNDHGWGTWSGTSFSTPIVSGILARNFISDSPKSLPQLRASLTCFYDFDATGRGQGEACYIPVEQGVLP